MKQTIFISTNCLWMCQYPAAPQIQTGWNTLQNIASYLSMTKGASVDISFINTRFPMAMTNTTVRRIGDRIIGTTTSTFDMQSHMLDRLDFVQNLLFRLGAPIGSVNIDIPQFNYFRNNSSVGFGFR